MSKEQTNSADSSVDFNIKHRLAGAGVLIFFGVLILPWMLGPPGDNVGGQTAHAARDSELVEAVDLLAVESNDDFVADNDVEETVYISKITPLDGEGSSKPASETATPPAEPVGSRVERSEKTETTAKKAVTEQVKKTVASSTVKSEPKAEEKPITSSEETKPDVAVQTKPATVEEKEASKPTPVVAATSSIEVGWVVQVGLFSRTGYKLRAEKMVSDLVNDGFKAGSTVVETNKGEGLRVWLGPFAKRAEASKEVERLKGATGKDGFVRVYP